MHQGAVRCVHHQHAHGVVGHATGLGRPRASRAGGSVNDSGCNTGSAGRELGHHGAGASRGHAGTPAPTSSLARYRPLGRSLSISARKAGTAEAGLGGSDILARVRLLVHRRAEVAGIDRPHGDGGNSTASTAPRCSRAAFPGRSHPALVASTAASEVTLSSRGRGDRVRREGGLDHAELGYRVDLERHAEVVQGSRPGTGRAMPRASRRC